ncbi:MAG: hypothetical protein ACRDJO_04645 [Actinomycetota bacterium]
MEPLEVTVRIIVDAPDAKSTEPVVAAALARFGDSVVKVYPLTDYDKFPDCWDAVFEVQAADRPAAELAVEAARALGEVAWEINDADSEADAIWARHVSPHEVLVHPSVRWARVDVSPPAVGLPDDYEFDTLDDEPPPEGEHIEIDYSELLEYGESVDDEDDEASSSRPLEADGRSTWPGQEADS